MNESIERRDSAKLEPYIPELSFPFGAESPKGKTLRDHWRVLISRRWLIAAVALSVMTGVVIQTFTATPIYRSTAKVRIDPELPNILPYKGIVEPSEGYVSTQAYLQTQYEILNSRSLARRVIDKLDLARDPDFSRNPGDDFLTQARSTLSSAIHATFSVLSPEEGKEGQQDEDKMLVNRFLEGLEVNLLRNSRLVDVSYTSHRPEFAAKAVNTLVNEFIEQNFETQYGATVRATDFLQRQLEELKIKVERSEEELTRYAREHGILNIEERESIVLQRLSDLNLEMTRVQVDLLAKTAAHRIVQETSLENFPHSLKNDLIVGLEKRLSELEQQLSSLSVRFGLEWPEIQKINQEIQEVNEQLRREKESARRQIGTEYRVAWDHYELLSSMLEEQKELANQLGEDSIQYNILKREVETSKQIYDGLLQRLKEAGVSAGLRSGNIQLVDRGEVPSDIYRPRKAFNLIVGLVVGLVLGVGLALFVESMDNTVKTPDQVVQFLAIPSLGVIPRIAERMRIETEGMNKDGAIIPYREKSHVWEAYRALRTSILLSSPGRQPKTILITSAVMGEGKTTTVINVGSVFSQTGSRTLLMDLDMRKPMLARQFGIENGAGMSTFLSGNSDLASQIFRTSVPNLCVLRAGPVPPNPAELMGSERMKETLNLLRQYFTYIIIDSPPVLSVTDPVVLAPQVDGVVMVIQGGKTSRDSVRRASEKIWEVGGRILGAIVNDIDIESLDYYYYYRHYYDYGCHRHDTMDKKEV